MANKKLVGENYSTPELRAKVTGRSKYAEDFRAEGMLFARLLLSPYAHARIKSIDASAALAMPGVKAILTGDDVPGPKDQINDNGTIIRANPRSETALTNEAMYQGQPVLAVCAVSELAAAEAIERIKIKWEPLPFNVDPVASLVPGAQNPRVEGNVWKRPGPPAQGQPPGIPEPIDVKWNEAEVEEFRQGRLPVTRFTDPEWKLGDVEEGFKKAALILDETFVSANVSHQCLESRTAMAFWQNGKLHIHTSTQGVAQAVFSFVRWLELKPEDIVLVNEYTGGGYGSKGGGSITDIIPALLSKKLGGAPVMMRISREEEHAIGRARPAMHSRVKVGFTKEGRVTAVDMFTVTEGGPFGPGGDGNTASGYASLMYQPETFRYRGITAITNTPPRGALTQPGGFQGCLIMDEIVDKAARKLGIDQVAIRKLNAPEGKAKYGPADAKGQRGYVTSCFIKEALDKGAARFNWNERVARGEQRNGIEGARHRRRHQLLQRRLGRIRRSLHHQAGRRNDASILESAISAPNHSPIASAWRRRWSACRGRKWRSSGAIRRGICRGAATRAAARRYTRIRARRTRPRPTRSPSCSRSPPRISAGDPRTTKWAASASTARAAAAG